MLIFQRGQPTTTSAACVSDDDFSSSNLSSSSSTSVAASIVSWAAERLGDVDPQELFQKLEAEKIREDWQLEYLDSQQWQMLGVPMGLVASIRRCLAERKLALVGDNQESSSSSYLSPLPERSPRRKATISSKQIKGRLDTLSEGLSPRRTAPQSILCSPPTKPTRQVSQPDIASKIEFTALENLTAKKRAMTFPDAVPPALPQRLESLEQFHMDSEIREKE